MSSISLLGVRVKIILFAYPDYFLVVSTLSTVSENWHFQKGTFVKENFI